MLVETLKLLFRRDLERLKQEIDSYQEETKIWCVEEGIANSAGNLCLHLVGNLNTYIGAELGKTGYVRQRELEFSQKGISKAELLATVEDTIAIIDKALDIVTSEQLAQQYPILVFQEMTSTEYLLVHLTTHLTYHLGQINYHRRLLDT